MAISRREFLRVGVGGVSFTLFYSALPPAIASAGGSHRMLVVLTLAGGNDTLNTLIPYTDPKYRAARPTLAIPDAQILKIDDRFGLHPSLARLEDLYRRGDVAFINDVGFATLDRSHFRCRDVWQAADESYRPGNTAMGGWLGRFADLYLPEAARKGTTAIAVGPTVPVGLSAKALKATAVIDPDLFESSTSLNIDDSDPVDAAVYRDALFEVYREPRSVVEAELVRRNGLAAFETADDLKGVDPPSAVMYPPTYLGKTMQLVARLAGRAGTSLAWVTLDGFDTHGLQPGTHAMLLTDVSTSLSAFQEDLAARGIADQVMVLAWSEFSRRLYENGNRGTDHGKAGTVFVVGNKVKGGIYGGVPDLSDLDEGDLKTKVDFRSVYWTLIQDWFGRDPLPVLNGRFENLGFIERLSRNRAARH